MKQSDIPALREKAEAAQNAYRYPQGVLDRIEAVGRILTLLEKDENSVLTISVQGGMWGQIQERVRPWADDPKSQIHPLIVSALKTYARTLAAEFVTIP